MKFFLLFLLLMPSVASAHQLDSDSTIGAVLHVDPSDDPIIGEVSNFYWDIEDTTGRFKLDECNCMVHISHAGKELIEAPVSVSSATTAQFAYTFRERGAYSIELMGEQLVRGAFSDFSLKYIIRVTRTAEGTGVPDYVWAVPGGVAVIALALFARKVPRQKGRGNQHEER